MNKTVIRPINTAFAVLFMLLVAVVIVHVNSVSSAGGNTVAAMRMTSEHERFRALERDIRNAAKQLRLKAVNLEDKVAILDIELEQIENTLRDLAASDLSLPGKTSLAQPFDHVREARAEISLDTDNLEFLLSPEQPLDRALQASLYVVRNNITRLGEGMSVETASLNSMNDRARGVALFTGVAAVLVFLPIRIMAGRAAAKPIEALRVATDALAEDRWNPASITCDSDDAVGDLVGAFRTMAAKLQESRDQRAESFHRTLASLVQAIEAKDTFTSNHSCNVSRYAGLLARAHGLSDAEVQEIAYGGLLHDIGKIGVPDEIINKPGKLTVDEFDIIKTHPVIGDRIIAPLDGAEMLHAPVRHHHEHWDGSGYPDGLSGEDIPLVARIITVADVFEALTSDRPYRKAMSVERASSILREESGTVLDPTLVESFLENVLPHIGAELRLADSDESAPKSPDHSDAAADSTPSPIPSSSESVPPSQLVV